MLIVTGGAVNGDFNHDGIVDQADMDIVSNHWQQSSGNVQWLVNERFIYDAYGTFGVRVRDAAGTWHDDWHEYLGWANFHQGLRIDRHTGTFESGRWTEGTGWYENRHRIYSATMGRFAQPEPYGAEYIDGANLYWALVDNPINHLDSTGLLTILVHEADSGGASGHAALVIEDPVASKLPGKYPSGRAVLSWQGSKQGTIQAQFTDLYVYDFDDYLKASYGNIFEWRVDGCGKADETRIFASARTRQTWAADRRNNCAIRVVQTLTDVLPNSSMAKEIEGAITPQDIQRALATPSKVYVGTGKKSGSSTSCTP